MSLKEISEYVLYHNTALRCRSCRLTAFYNQGAALVHVYTDGSVLVTHGGVEVGQGLHTKMAQVAARSFGIPMSKIHLTETSTNTVPNGTPTAASASTDLNGMAVKVRVTTCNAHSHSCSVW